MRLALHRKGRRRQGMNNLSKFRSCLANTRKLPRLLPKTQGNDSRRHHEQRAECRFPKIS